MASFSLWFPPRVSLSFLLHTPFLQRFSRLSLFSLFFLSSKAQEAIRFKPPQDTVGYDEVAEAALSCGSQGLRVVIENESESSTGCQRKREVGVGRPALWAVE
ncbi:uncharacterized protein EI97DRAFT_428923 [Westerdykella ornata]|uniref:Uncharacterized protein n=1 Tax=Westerdykella ornata TaxID=318751 RepID=A0A6A6K0F7_WESOR|nr:uncharacterized protein EI97DRAFT_428923 [Westerdykella ornata]KAF2280829.1 hypothetical protein EI97DRAFT_428923 [Westerdykella ornata]